MVTGGSSEVDWMERAIWREIDGELGGESLRERWKELDGERGG
jgi:hypothetical protein